MIFNNLVSCASMVLKTVDKLLSTKLLTVLSLPYLKIVLKHIIINMANIMGVIGETKKVLEIMREAEDKIQVLEEELRRNELLHEQIESNLKDSRIENNKIAVCLEDSHDLQNRMKKYNMQLMNFGQNIYSCGQELYAAVHKHESELAINEERFECNEVLYLNKEGSYKQEEDKLTQDIILMKERESNLDKSTDLQHQMLVLESDKLEEEITNIGAEYDRYEDLIKQYEGLDQLEAEYSTYIANADNCLLNIDSEIQDTSGLLNETEKYIDTAVEEATNCVLAIDKKVQEIASRIDIGTKTFEGSKMVIQELSEKLAFIENSIIQKEETLDGYEKDIATIDTNMKEMKENSKNEVACCEKSCLQNEELYKIQQEMQEKLKMEICFYKTKIEEKDEEINNIVTAIAVFEDTISKVDLNEVLEAKQNEVVVQKSIRQSLKEDYNKKISEIQAEAKRSQEEIDLIEVNNKILQDEIDQKVLELDNHKAEYEAKTREKQMQEQMSKDLDNLIGNYTVEISTLQAELVRNRERMERTQAVVAAVKPRSVPTTKEKRTSRHWDSDSSVEGVNRRFSQAAKKKLKKMQAKK